MPPKYKKRDEISNPVVEYKRPAKFSDTEVAEEAAAPAPKPTHLKATLGELISSRGRK